MTEPCQAIIKGMINFIMTLDNRWTLWARALGQKSGRTDREADIVALIRTGIALIYLVTNIIICLGVWRHWGCK